MKYAAAFARRVVRFDMPAFGQEQQVAITCDQAAFGHLRKRLTAEMKLSTVVRNVGCWLAAANQLGIMVEDRFTPMQG